MCLLVSLRALQFFLFAMAVSFLFAVLAGNSFGRANLFTQFRRCRWAHTFHRWWSHHRPSSGHNRGFGEGELLAASRPQERSPSRAEASAPWKHDSEFALRV